MSLDKKKEMVLRMFIMVLNVKNFLEFKIFIKETLIHIIINDIKIIHFSFLCKSLIAVTLSTKLGCVCLNLAYK